MTKEEIINIAWNIFPISNREKNEAFIELLVQFAQAIAEKEREECAKIVEESSLPDTYSQECLPEIANDIRARGQE
jgi:hypothetical protein